MACMKEYRLSATTPCTLLSRMWPPSEQAKNNKHERTKRNDNHPLSSLVRQSRLKISHESTHIKTTNGDMLAHTHGAMARVEAAKQHPTHARIEKHYTKHLSRPSWKILRSTDDAEGVQQQTGISNTCSGRKSHISQQHTRRGQTK